MDAILNPSFVAVAVVVFLVITVLLKTAVVVPQQNEYVVERLGKYHGTLGSGFHILLPFLDKVAYKFSLKEVAIDTPSQTCITKDNVSVDIDGLIYIQVVDSKKAAYGIENFGYAASQLAQTTLRSEVGKIELDKTFEEREKINLSVVDAIDQAAESWGIKVLRYEIKDIVPPESVKEAMEAQMTAEREKRAAIARSVGDKESTINRAEGQKRDAELRSEGERARLVNEAKGKAEAIKAVAEATAEGLRKIATEINAAGGMEAAQLRVAEQYVAEFGKLAKESNTMIVPADVGSTAGMIGAAMEIFKKTKD